VVANFVSSFDGAAAGPDDRSGSLSGPADKAVFHALRAAADVVLAGAGTVRAENYGRPRLTDEQQELRRSQGRPPLPRLAVVTRSLRLDPAARFFSEALPEQLPIILTTATGVTEQAEHVRRLEGRATIVVAGETTVDWALALRLLHDEAGAEVVLTEGGPTVVGELVTADLLDEMCLTVAPLVAGGDAPRIVSGARLASTAAHRLTRVFESEGFLLLRYLRDRATG
jgi:riboflavin-specific deaminase-like protein